ncbi:MAG: hypothetical protein KGL35_19100 [Bradyrhizobium sp.]|nr:hypothetical protein [Bradyrhizobium sp.]
MSHVQTIHTLAPCTDCGYRAVLVDGRCPRCKIRAEVDAKLYDAHLRIGELTARLSKVSAELDAARKERDDLKAANDRTEAAIDSIKHLGLRRLFWLARGNELEALFAAGADTFELRDLVRALADEMRGDEAEHLVGRAMGLDE